MVAFAGRVSAGLEVLFLPADGRTGLTVCHLSRRKVNAIIGRPSRHTHVEEHKPYATNHPRLAQRHSHRRKKSMLKGNVSNLKYKPTLLCTKENVLKDRTRRTKRWTGTGHLKRTGSKNGKRLKSRQQVVSLDGRGLEILRGSR